MKKYISLVILATLVGVGCAKTTDSSSRTITRRAGSGNTAVDNTAKSMGLNISWVKSEVAEAADGATVTSVTHEYTINGKSVVATHNISANVPQCSARQSLQYDVAMDQTPVNGIYSAVGYTTCQEGTHYYVGASFMAWNAQSSLVQEFVLMDLTSKGEAISIQKQISSQSNSTYLLDWVSYLFNVE